MVLFYNLYKSGLFLLSFIFWLSPLCYGHNNQNDILGTPKDTIYIAQLEQIKYYPNQRKYIINNSFDLKGKILALPKNVTLDFRDGLFHNGTIVGDNTRVLYKGVCFDNIDIQGSWLVPVISSSMFKDLSGDNDLQKLFLLANAEITNKIILQSNVYTVKALKDDVECIRVPSNTEVVLQGIVILRPNEFTHSYIFRLTGENITISGGGMIIGDKNKHIGEKGEWGMGIFIWNGRGIVIDNITIKDCWGDCVYIGGDSREIKITNCRIDNGRRQGVSVTSADGVLITDCIITNISGHAPEYGIDIEPNSGQSVDNVLIHNLNIINCKGGILAYGYENKASIGSLSITNCIITGSTKIPLRFYGCERIELVKCILDYPINAETPIYKENVRHYLEKDNVVK